MFDREATLSARMRHPNIVRIFDHGDYEGERYLAMEHLHGRDLSSAMMELIKRGTPSPGLGAFVGQQMCRALAYVHGLRGDDGAPLQLVHRDVSLSNVMLGFDGSIKLVDFGVAKALADELTQRTQAGVLKGKWAYLAPEQVEGGVIDQRADLFSLGIVLWEMLTGRRLFKAASGLQTLERVRAAWVLPPSTINPAVPAELDAVVMKALAKAPAERWQSAAELAAALAGPAAELGFGAAELEAEMAELFADEAAALRAARETTPPQAAAEPDLHDAITVPVVRGATLAELRRPEAPRGWWRLLLAAALA
jgi:eukaryotic-like serine/threonine-protein kinase